MKNINNCIFIIVIFFAACKDDHWGDRTLDFAHNEAPLLIESLSRKDLESKWFSFYLYGVNFGLSEINKAQLMLNSFEPIDLTNINTDKEKLMSVAFIVDKQIEKIYEINQYIYNAKEVLEKMDLACSNKLLLNFYTDNRLYLYNSLQMVVPQMNFTYFVSGTFSYGDNSSGKNDTSGGIDAIPLIGNITSYFKQKAFEKNLEKFKEAQAYINNYKLIQEDIERDSEKICFKQKTNFLSMSKILKETVEIVDSNFIKVYQSLINVKNTLSPIVIEKIIDNFSSEDKFIYSINSDNSFTNRIIEIATFAKNIKVIRATSKEDLTLLETKIELIEGLLNEIKIMDSSSLASNKKSLLKNTSTLLTIKLEGLRNIFNNGVRL